MDFINQTRFIERLQFFNNQRLFASDLQGLEAFNREMRWLHNKSLHQPGIGNGLAVTGRKGEREVVVGPGYAIDGEGREIVLTQSVVEPVPPVAGEDDGGPVVFDLTISYPADAFLEESERRTGICRQPGGTIRLQEKPVFCWVRLNANLQPADDRIKGEMAAGMRLQLARAEVLNCQLEKDVSIAQRISARPARMPYVCCGTTEPDWQPWVLVRFDPPVTSPPNANPLVFPVAAQGFNRPLFPFILPVGLQAEIDTTECGFLTTPCYSARIAGPRVKQYTSSVVVGRARVVSVGSPGVTVDDASPFREGDVVTVDETATATVSQVKENNLTLNGVLPGLGAGDTLRIANISPSHSTFRMSHVGLLDEGLRVIVRGEDAAHPGNIIAETATIEIVDEAESTVMLDPALVNTFNMDVPPDRAPVLVAQHPFTLLVDGMLQVVNPRPGKFTAQVLLMAQLFMPPSDSTFAAPVFGGGQLSQLAEQVEEQARRIINDNFSDWQLVWMGVEG